MVRGTQVRGRRSGVRLTSRPRRTIIPSLDPITRRRGRGLSDIPRQPALARPPPRPRPVLGTDFSVLQPFGGRRRKPVPRGIRKGGQKIFVGGRRPTRVTVASPSERRDRLITVSSRSRLAREESVRRPDRRPDIFRTGARGKKVKIKRGRARRIETIPPPRRREPQGFDFMPFQQISFREGRGRRFGEEEQRQRRRAPPRRRRRTEDFGLGNIFNVEF